MTKKQHVATPSTNAIKIQPVQNPKDLNRFIEVPWSIYQNDDLWVPPLKSERRLHLSPKNPYFAHARWQAWIAYLGDRPVGRISAQIDDLYLQRYDQPAGFFGLLESIDDPSVFALLLEAAESWLQDQGIETIQGPFNLSINQECGLLIEGFDKPPVFMMPHNPPYYARQLEALNYSKAKDLLAFLIDAQIPPPEAGVNLSRKAAQEMHVRPLKRSRLKEEFELLRDIFNDAWADNWGFVPFTKEEFQEIGSTLRFVIDDDFVQIAEYQGEAVGMIIAMPDLNQLIRDLNGKLFPLGWLKLLWRWKTAYPDMGRVPLMGVRSRYRNNLIGAAIAYLLIESLRQPVVRKGIKQMELSWILEDNQRIRGVIESLGGRCYKRYRIYQKSLT